MTNPILTRLAPIALSFCLAAGCANDTEPTAEDYDEIAQGVAPLITRDVRGSLELSAAVATGDTPLFLSASAGGTFEGLDGALSVELSLMCSTAEDEALDVCDETTDRAAVEGSFDGMLALGGWSGAIDANASWAIDGTPKRDHRGERFRVRACRVHLCEFPDRRGA